MRWIWVWLVFGCASQKSAESHADYVAEVQTTKTEGAERVTVLEFGPLPGQAHEREAESDGGACDPKQHQGGHVGGDDCKREIDDDANHQNDHRHDVEPSPDSPEFHGYSLPPHGPLLKATVIDRAPVVTTTKASADAHTDAESASRWNLGFGFWTKVLIAAGAALALLLAWRFRSGLLGGVLKLIGK